MRAGEREGGERARGEVVVEVVEGTNAKHGGSVTSYDCSSRSPSSIIGRVDLDCWVQVGKTRTDGRRRMDGRDQGEPGKPCAQPASEIVDGHWLIAPSSLAWSLALRAGVRPLPLFSQVILIKERPVLISPSCLIMIL